MKQEAMAQVASALQKAKEMEEAAKAKVSGVSRHALVLFRRGNEGIVSMRLCIGRQSRQEVVYFCCSRI